MNTVASTVRHPTSAKRAASPPQLVAKLGIRLALVPAPQKQDCRLAHPAKRDERSATTIGLDASLGTTANDEPGRDHARVNLVVTLARGRLTIAALDGVVSIQVHEQTETARPLDERVDLGPVVVLAGDDEVRERRALLAPLRQLRNELFEDAEQR